MAKKVEALVKLQSWQARLTPAPPVGTALAARRQHHAVYEGI